MARAAPEEYPEEHGLLSGDIQIEGDDYNYTPHRSMDDQSEAVGHGVVIDASSDGTAYMHSTQGTSSGVKKYTYDHASRTNPNLVLRCKDPVIREELRNVAEVFSLTPDEKKATGRKEYLTQYRFPHERHAKRTALDERFPLACAYLRGMRTFQKSQLGGKQALSENQGIACGQFVMYSLQAAVYGQMHTAVFEKLDDAAKDLLTRSQAAVDARLAGGDGDKLKDVMAGSEEQMAQLNEQLQALIEADDPTMANLAYFNLNPKGQFIDDVVDALMACSPELVEPMVSIPVVLEDGTLTTYVLTTEQACKLCPDGEGVFAAGVDAPDEEVHPIEKSRVDAFLARDMRLKDADAEVKADASASTTGGASMGGGSA